MDSKEFRKILFKTGEVSTDDILKYMLKNYFLKGYGLEELEADMILKYNTSEYYAKALKESFEKTLKDYSR